jgi:hypothetical protein
MKFFALSFW